MLRVAARLAARHSELESCVWRQAQNDNLPINKVDGALKIHQ